MNEDLYGRLYNWKFEQALFYVAGEPEDLQKAVALLARLFGDPGYFGGAMGELVLLVVRALCKDEEP